MNDYLDKINAERTEKVKATGLKPGWFVNMASCYDDVWNEVKSINDIGKGSMTIYTFRENRDRTTEYGFLCDIRKVRDKIPSDARIVITKDGRYGGNDGKPFSELPAEIRSKRLVGVCKVHPTKGVKVILENEEMEYFTIPESKEVEKWNLGREVTFDSFNKEAYALFLDYRWYIDLKGIHEIEVKEAFTKNNDLKIVHNEVKYKFQYDNKQDHKNALNGHWSRGYLIRKFKGETYVTEAWVKKDTQNRAKTF